MMRAQGWLHRAGGACARALPAAVLLLGVGGSFASSCDALDSAAGQAPSLKLGKETLVLSSSQGGRALHVQSRLTGNKLDGTIPVKRVPIRSSLVTDAAAQAWQGEARIGDLHTTAFSAAPSEGEPLLVGAAGVRKGEVHFTAYRRNVDAALPARLRLNALERLYSFVHHQDPFARFYSETLLPQFPKGGSQAAAMDAVFRARNCVLAELAGDPSLRPMKWEQAQLTMLAAKRKDSKQVGALVRDSRGRPVADASVAFMRGEHLVCDAKTDARGAASCRLFDSHGHAEHDDDDAPTAVTFGGMPRAESMLLPRALVHRPAHAGKAHKH